MRQPDGWWDGLQPGKRRGPGSRSDVLRGGCPRGLDVGHDGEDERENWKGREGGSGNLKNEEFKVGI